MKNNKIRIFGILFFLLLIIPGLLISPGSGEKNPEPFFGGIIVMDDDPVPSDSIQSIRYMLPCDDGVIPSQSNTSNKTTIPERSGVPGENVSSVRATPAHDPYISQDFQLLMQKNRITLSGGFTNHSSEITYGVPERTVRGRALGLMLSLAKVRINTISFRAVSENQVEISQGKGYNLTIMNPNLTEHGVDNYSSEDPVLNIISDGVLFQTQKGTSVNFTFDSVHEPGNYHLSIFNASCSRIKDITDWTVLPSGVWYD